MRSTTMSPENLIAGLWPERVETRWLRAVALAVGGSLLSTLSAKVEVPCWPVPMTMQTFAVLVVAMALGPRLGVATVLLYLAEGALGLPVFAGTPARGLGLAYMTGPTGGYLAGFLAAAALMGWLTTRGWDRRVMTTLAAMVLGTLVIFGLGYAWLAGLIGLAKAWQFGVLPFLPGAALTTPLAAMVLPAAWRLLNRRRR